MRYNFSEVRREEHAISFFTIYARLICSALMFLLYGQQAIAQTPQGRAEAVREIMDMWAQQQFSGAVIISEAGEVTLRYAVGFSRLSPPRPFQIDDIAQMGSISKSFTSLALLSLWHDGKVRLEAPVAAYLGQEGDASLTQVSIEQLLGHRAGYGEYCGEDFEQRSLSELLNYCASLWDEEKAGAFHYSNIGYSLAAAVVENVSGLSLDDYLKTRFFGPLSMKDTGYFYTTSQKANMVAGYRDNVQQPIIASALEALDGQHYHLVGNGGMQSSLADMLTWYQKVIVGSFLPESLKAKWLSPAFAQSATRHEGYGWFIFTDAESEEVTQISHSGSDGVFFSYFLVRPRLNLFMYFVGSSGEDRIVAVLREILEILPPR